MDPQDLISSLASSRAGISAMFYGVTDDHARWRPEPGKWTMLEVLNHLYDEERDDFRQRIQMMFAMPGEPWPSFDPVGRVESQNYNERDVYDSLGAFEEERDASLIWLRSLENPDWSLVHTHKKLGDIRAGDLLAAWAAHDYMHIRQLAGLSAAYTTAHVAPFSTWYAAP